MMNKQTTLAIAAGLLLVFLASSCTKDQMQANVALDTELQTLIRATAADGKESFYVLPDADDLANIPQDPKNPLTQEKVDLGKFLFFDTGLGMDAKFESGMGTYSCASCHIPSAGFRPGAKQGIADGGVGFGLNGEGRARNTDYPGDSLDAQGARPISLVNVAFVRNTFWNGQFGADGINIGTEDVWGEHRPATELNELGFQGIETQNIEGLHTHRYRVDKELLEEYDGYVDMFDAAFPDVQESERYNLLTASLAISAYIRTILSTEAPFQSYLKGDRTAMTYEEKEGAILFFDKAKCTNCHHNPNLGSLEFHALGVNDLHEQNVFNTDPSDFRVLGRGGFTGDDEDNYKFKVPGIYNMSDTPFYFHGSSKTSLYDVVEYKSDRIAENAIVPEGQLSDEWEPLSLTVEEKQKLVLFLEKSLRDPHLERYQPDFVPSGNCFPNADPKSKLDIGCP